jgi:bacterial/archaeal transporter family protein
MWKFYALLSAVFAAATALLAKCGVHNINSNLATAIRTTVILILTWGIVFFTGGINHLRELTWKASAFLIASGIATGLSWLFYFKALQCGDVSRVAPIDKLSVVLVVICGVLFFHERLTWQLAAGTICIAAGTLFLLQAH